MNNRKWIDEYAEDNDIELLVMNEYDEAIVGIGHRFNDTFVLYDREKLLEILARDMAKSIDDPEDDPETMAWEHFDFNIIGGWVGSATPAFVELPPPVRCYRCGSGRQLLAAGGSRSICQPCYLKQEEFEVEQQRMERPDDYNVWEENQIMLDNEGADE